MTAVEVRTVLKINYGALERAPSSFPSPRPLGCLAPRCDVGFRRQDSVNNNTANGRVKLMFIYLL